ncbi:Aldo/keto reductase [Cadophora sp. DSE1049]|nr:Aldo/keto reductase [Cadophora sp. DSE1049]
MMKYTYLGCSGHKVSRICFGCMTFGDRRGQFKWCIEEPEALPILKACYDAGINFFDTSNNYSSGVSEEILGNTIKKKHIFDSVNASLKRLDLEYIDLLQIHRFDPNTPVKEMMKVLHDIVESGKYTARLHGWTEFIPVQNLHYVTYRAEEKEIIPSLEKFRMGMIPYFKDSDRGEAMGATFMGQKMTATDEKINRKIEEIAKKRGVSMAIVAIAWSLSKHFMTAPIAVNFELSKEEIESIDNLYEPKNVLGIAV